MHRLGWQHLALLVIAAVAVPARAEAQARLEVGPAFGGYIPIGSYGPNDQFSASLPSKPGDLGAMAWGAEARLWLTRRVGIGFLGTVAASRFGGGLALPCTSPPTVCGVTPPNHGTIAVGAAQVLLRPAARGPLTVSAGFGLVRHGGDAYESFNAPTPLAGVCGVGLDLPLARNLRAALGITALIYGFDVRDWQGLRFEHGTQVDLLPHLSLTWTTHPT